MDKLAQKRRLDWMNRLREDYSPLGKYTETKSEEFTRLMEVLREVDEKVREIALTDEDGKGALKSLLKVAKSNFNRREYVMTVIYLGRFHDKLSDIKNEFSKLQRDLSKAHNEFLFGDLEKDQKEFLMNKMPEKFQPKAKEAPSKKKAASAEELVKEAGISDWLHNMNTDRGKALKAWEKRFPQYAKQLKKDTEKMINKSETMAQVLFGALKPLAQARGKRQLEDYLKITDGLLKKYDQYDSYFNEYYNTHVAKLIETQKGMDSEVNLKQLDEEAERVVREDSAPNTEVSQPSFRSPFPAADPVDLPDDAVVTPGRQSTKPQSGGAGVPADFPKPPDSEDDRVDQAIFDKMHDLESKMGNPPASSHAPAAASSRALSRLPSSKMVHTNPEWSVDLTDLEPPTSRVPSVPFRSTKPSPPPPSQSGITQKNPSIDFFNPTIPKAPAIPREFAELPPATLPMSQGPDTDIDSPKTIRSASDKFIEELTASGEQNPLVLANKIVKFANSIANADKVTSDKLLVIAKKILSNL